MAEVGVFEAIHTLLQITRYKPDPVPQEAIEKVIEAATMAPSGGNMQEWEFIVITDRDLVAQVARVYREIWLEEHGEEPREGERPVYKRARHLAKHMHEVPVLILMCADHQRGYWGHTQGDPIVRGIYAHSIWPAAQNLFLAARGLGLGTRITTNHMPREQEIKELLGIPDYVETVALIPMGYPQGKFVTPKRRPAAEVTSYNRYGNRKV